MPDITGVYNGKNKDRHDRWYTPTSALSLLDKPFKYSQWKEIYDPFCGDGRIVKYFRDKGIEAEGSDIEDGIDFFSLDNEFWNYIIDNRVVIVSNPPYSITTKILERLCEMSKYGVIQFALLMPLTTLDSKKRHKYFRILTPDIYIPSKRIQFENAEGKSNDRINFLTCWFVTGFGNIHYVDYEG